MRKSIGGFVLGLLVGTVGIEVIAQQMQLDDGTFGMKVVPFGQDGGEISQFGPTEIAEGATLGDAAPLTPIGVRECDTAASGTGVTNGDIGALCQKDGYVYFRGFLTNSSGTELTFASEDLAKFHSSDLDETEEEADDNAGCLASFLVSNTHSAVVYLNFWDLDADDVTPATTVPSFQVALAAGSTTALTGGFGMGSGCWAYSNGLTVGALTEVGQDGTAAGPGANTVLFTAFTKD